MITNLEKLIKMEMQIAHLEALIRLLNETKDIHEDNLKVWALGLKWQKQDLIPQGVIEEEEQI